MCERACVCNIVILRDAKGKERLERAVMDRNVRLSLGLGIAATKGLY